MSEWQPIETAPNEGFFLAYYPALEDQEACSLVTQAWRDDTGFIFGIGAQEENDWPTHWMPLPEPPVDR